MQTLEWRLHRFSVWFRTHWSKCTILNFLFH